MLERQQLQGREGEIIDYFQGGPADGPLLWCLHGFPDSHRNWRSLGEALIAQGFRVVIPAIPGYSDGRGVGDGRIETLANRLLEWMEQINPGESLSLVGHDWGAILSYSLAVQAPDRIQRIVAAAVPHLAGMLRLAPAQWRRSWYIGFFQLPRWPEMQLARGALVERLWRNWSPDLDADEYVTTARDQLRDPAVAKAALAYYRALPGQVLDDRRGQRVPVMQDCPVPALQVAGADDGCIGLDMFRQQQRYFPAGYAFKVIEGAGHFMCLEAESEFVAAVRDFLA